MDDRAHISKQLLRATSDVSLMSKPARSFADLRASHQHLLRADTMTGAESRPHTHNAYQAKRIGGKRSKARAIAAARGIHPESIAT